MFQVTAAAAEQIKSAAEAQDEEPFLRVAAKIDDGGLVYGMGFDEERENDVVIECHGFSVLISPRSQELLDEATLDFVELHPGEFQFVFINPKEGSCSGNSGNSGGPSGCGTCGGGCA
jgi:iron-sulfur cluster assembly protein